MIEIAALMTVFNRREHTLACLRSLYAQESSEIYKLRVYLVDGGSTDGTYEAVLSSFPEVEYINGDGLYWAGGMRTAWDAASCAGNPFDFYLLLNDDTVLLPGALDELISSHRKCLLESGKAGIYVGTTMSENGGAPSYGGWRLENSHSNSKHLLSPNGSLQPCQLANANIMMVSSDAFRQLGNLCGIYTHGIADYDYSLRAVRAGIPVMVTPSFLGICKDDHGNNWKSSSVSLKKRIDYLYSVKGLAYKEYLYWLREFFPGEYQSGRAKLWLKTLFPRIWDLMKLPTYQTKSGFPKKKVLFIMHLPPPVHGAALMGKFIRESNLVNSTFDCRYINLTFADTLNDISKPSLKKIVRTFSFLSMLKKELKSFTPDLVYVTPNSSGFAFFKEYLIVRLLKRKKCRIVLHFHNKGISEKQDRLPYRLLYPSFFKNTKLILLSKRLYSDVCRYVRECDVMYCPNGLPDNALETLVKKTRIPHILFLSNLYVAKGLDVLLDACVILKNRGLAFVCDIAGAPTSDYDENSFRNRLKELGIDDCVQYHGPVFGTDKAALYAEADIFVFPSMNEAFSLVVLEAMSNSLPVIASSQGGIPDMVCDAGNGFIIDGPDVQLYASKMQYLMENPELALRMGQSGRKIFEEKYSLEVFENNIVACLENA